MNPQENARSNNPDSLAKRVNEVLKLSHRVNAPTEKEQPVHVHNLPYAMQNQMKKLDLTPMQVELEAEGGTIFE